MTYFSRSRPWAWLGAGLVLGWMVSSFWPNTPLHAVATDRAENITIATGLVDNEIEAVFFLDAQTGMLRAGVPSMRQPGVFQAVWEGNLTADLATVVTQVNATIRTQNAGRKAARRHAARNPASAEPQVHDGHRSVGYPPRSLTMATRQDAGLRGRGQYRNHPGLRVAVEPQCPRRQPAMRQRLQLWADDKLATAIVPGEE